MTNKTTAAPNTSMVLILFFMTSQQSCKAELCQFKTHLPKIIICKTGKVW